MTYRRLGDSGLTVSTAGLGCNTFGATLAPDGVAEVVDAAIDAGVTFFDTADVYGGVPGQSEELLGAALRGRRDDVVVATKFGMDVRGLHGADWGARGSRRYVRRAVEGSLRRLGTDYVDLYQLHAPDPATPVEETLAALHELVLEGKVRYLGSSNLSAWQVVDADWVARTAGTTPFVSAQNRYNLLDRGAEADLVPAAEHVGVGILPYVPLASGLLTGKYRRGQEAPAGSRLSRMPQRLAAADFDRIEALSTLAEAWGVDLPTVALGGLAAQPAVASVISGARTPEQVRANVAAALWEPTLEQLAAIDEAAPGPA
ncbi:aldo/keto reductase [Cellulomonas wangsupingiae]|uniref:aldo/keto reductase n=1 Tax=Cellulomonas wangsupingiae TaxID=2968085 RepID=UPI001D0E3E39|nr:aldo/keto reductase [Cellulomonas wangsupingiae]MCM0638107.1 aldo/keto reductase [Cellulomonas wangsupingiae]